MNRSQFTLWILMGCASLVAAALPARAAVISFTETRLGFDLASGTGYSNLQASLPLQTRPLPDINYVEMNLPQFDPALGTLTGIRITDQWTGDSANTWQVSYTNNSATESVTFGRSFLEAYDFYNLIPGGVSLGSSSYSGALAAITLGPGESLTENIVNFMGKVDVINDGAPAGSIRANVNPALFSNYIGTGTVPAINRLRYQHSITSISGLSNPNNLSVIMAGDLNWKRTIEYTYTPVPEPASLSFLALGGLALLRRRRV